MDCGPKLGVRLKICFEMDINGTESGDFRVCTYVAHIRSAAQITMARLQLILSLLATAYASLDTANYDSSNCSQSSILGDSQYCCDGECFDGTEFLRPGACLHSIDICEDTSGAPSCGSNQVFHLYTPEYFVVVGGNCYLPALDACDWSSTRYHWGCCDCPAGYTSTQGGVCQDGNPLFYPCVRCTGANEFLSSDYSSCIEVQGLPCNIVCICFHPTRSSTQADDDRSTISPLSSIIPLPLLRIQTVTIAKC
jgi:hypothetical protein